jgi:hypothetical protein
MRILDQVHACAKAGDNLGRGGSGSDWRGSPVPSYATMELALARLHGADEKAQKGVLRGRIKHLQRLGLPLGQRPVKGRANDYSDEQVWQFALALEFAQCGIDPTTAVQIISAYWQTEIEDRMRAAHVQPRSRDTSILILTMEVLSSAWKPEGSTLNGLSMMRWGRIGALGPWHLKGRDNRRGIIINVTDMMKELHSALDELRR